jgi:hypothetical protein
MAESCPESDPLRHHQLPHPNANFNVYFGPYRNRQYKKQQMFSMRCDSRAHTTKLFHEQPPEQEAYD